MNIKCLGFHAETVGSELLYLLVNPGTILAVYGSERDDGKFLVEDHCFADMPTQLPMMGPSTDR